VVFYACGVFDTHCHLTFPEFRDDVASVVAECVAAGVTGLITISTTSRDALDCLAIAERYERVWCSAGVHPLYSDKAPHVWSDIRRVASHAKCVAWGELGLDNHYKEPARALQDAVLAEQLAFIESCHRGGIVKPVVIHCREATPDLLPVLRSSTLDPSRYVFHCFTGTASEARDILDFGAMISFTGVVTYHNAADVRAAAQLVPADRIMVETDAPFLSPVPHRGKRPCRPAWVRHTAGALAELRGVAFEEFHRQLNANTERFFGIPVT
jgi:TatD DNase family protein